MQQVLYFFNSNFFIAFVTLLVGSIAIFLYIIQRIGFKRDAASILIVEIRNAESTIDSLKKGMPLGPARTILPINNWNTYNYLFIKDLDFDEISLINDFYAQCSTISESLKQLSIGEQLEQKALAVQLGLSNIAQKAENSTVYNSKKKEYLDLYSYGESYLYRPIAPSDSIKKDLGNIKFVSTTTAGAKLKRIANLSY